MKIKIFATLFFVIFFYSLYAQYDFDNGHVDFYSKILEHKGIKKITERTFTHWKAISYFDREGYVLHETNVFKKEMRSDYRFSYTVTDSLAEIRRVDRIDLNNDGDTLRIERYYYDSSNRCYQYRVYSSEQDTSRYASRNNFVYEAGMLISYDKNILKYNEKKQKVSRLEVTGYTDSTFYTYMYNQSGQLTDFIKESHDNTIWYADAPSWSNTRNNKIHIRYSNFDNHGNWTRSYFITEKRKIFYSKRKIKYW